MYSMSVKLQKKICGMFPDAAVSVSPVISESSPLTTTYANTDKPEESRLPLLPLIILPLLPMLASLEVFRVPVSVRSIAISLKLRAAWIFD